MNMRFTIDDFWASRLKSGPTLEALPLVSGWSYQKEGFPTFKEAPLALDAKMEEVSPPTDAQILLVSAPGAVGKTTLAKQIAYKTNSIYVDLAVAGPVGSNTFIGSLHSSKLFAAWHAEKVAVLMDGLDEARLKVTHEAFELFLSEVAEFSSARTIPTVIFGRTEAIDYARIALSVHHPEVKVAGLEIGFYEFADSVDLADLIIGNEKKDRPHADAERRAAEILLSRLREQTKGDGSRFAGYAPVIHAVAMRVSRERNPYTLAGAESSTHRVTLESIARAILEREQEKLSTLPFSDSSLATKLYTPDEQIQRLVAHLYGLRPRVQLPSMNPADNKTYSNAIDTWVREHPFLGGDGQAATAVFDAMIGAKALRDPDAAKQALTQELRKGTAANPFLFEFYRDKSSLGPEQIPGEHIGILYSSVRASLSIGDTANLTIDEVGEPTEQEDEMLSDVEIVVQRGDDSTQTLTFRADQTDGIRLGAHVKDVDIAAQYADVVIGGGFEAALVSRVVIQCAKIEMIARRVSVEPSADKQTSVVALEADYFESGQTLELVCRDNVRLSCISEDELHYPWRNFATKPIAHSDPRTEEALRRLRKFVIAFRAHGKGRLARVRRKLEHSRMTKGTGQGVLNAMKKQHILTSEGQMYFLDAVRLFKLAGVNYGDCMAHRLGRKAEEFVRNAIN